MKTEKLWTRDFTIITLGTVVSMLGNSISGFAISLMVLDYTGSTFLYALFLVMYNLPKILMPLLAGPYIDRFSRKKIIYTLDFISAGIFTAAFFVINAGIFNYVIFLAVVFVVGSIDGIYIVAYESFYPNLISEGNYRKAYSVSSMIYPIAAFMLPVAAAVCKHFGSAAPLFAFNAVSFLIAAIFETQIKKTETHYDKPKKAFSSFADYFGDFREGLKYIISEKGLMVITIYFFATMLAGSGVDILVLPFFQHNESLFEGASILGFELDSTMMYAVITASCVFGRLVGGLIHYRVRIPAKNKFAVALSVYIIISVIQSFQLYLSVTPMMIAFFMVGIFSVTSYNIRISATQSYIPDEKRGRFNGTFEMICTFGSVIGELIAGAAGEFVGERTVIICLMGMNLICIFLIMFRGREYVKKIYNREV